MERSFSHVRCRRFSAVWRFSGHSSPNYSAIIILARRRGHTHAGKEMHLLDEEAGGQDRLLERRLKAGPTNLSTDDAWSAMETIVHVTTSVKHAVGPLHRGPIP